MIFVHCTEKDRKALKAITVDPAQIEDDGTDYTDRKIKKPWGYEIEKYRDQNLSIWFLHIHRDQETSMHCHLNKTTLLIVIGGKATLSTLSRNIEIEEGEIVIIEKGAFHRTTSNGEAVMMYELESPPNKRDLVRLEDSYGRGQGYEKIEKEISPVFSENEGT